MPVLKISQGIGQIESGQTLELVATDRGSLSDIPAWAKDLGHTLQEQFEADGEFHFVVQKS
jgi:tRNA 2-thiouridine synthesizing protein A